MSQTLNAAKATPRKRKYGIDLLKQVDPFFLNENEMAQALAQHEQMEKLLEGSSVQQRAERKDFVQGTVVQTTRAGHLVNIGRKYDGFVPLAQGEGLSTGEQAEFWVVSPSQPEGLIEMSHSQALGWRNLEAAQGTEQIVTVKAFALAKTRRSQKASGLRVCFEEGIHKGIRGFLPNMEISRGIRAEQLVGQSIEVVVLTAEPGRGSEFGNLVVSQRAACAVKDALTIEGMAENTIVDGRIIQFIKASPRDHKVSALVQLENGVVGLVHRTEVLSNQAALNDLYKVGDSLKLAVRAIDCNRHRVSLSLKLVAQLEKLATISVGQIVSAEVLRQTEYGYFCAIGGGLEGLLHNSDLARLSGRKIEEFKAGDRVEVKLLSYNPDGSRMALGRRQFV